MLKPPEEIPVDVWCERNIIIPDGPAPGSLHLDRTPYLREILNTLRDPQVEKVTLCKGSQVGGSTVLQLLMAYSVAQRPGAMLYMTSTEKHAKEAANNRFAPLVDASPVLKELQLTGRWDQSLLEKCFSTCSINFAGGHSTAEAKSRPIYLLLLDEIDEIGANLELVSNRTKSYRGAKVYQVSTPTDELGNVWVQYLKGSQESLYLPCPHPDCGEFQKLEAEQLKWDKRCKVNGVWNTEGVRDSTYYECIRCRGKIEDKHKQDMLKRGVWRSANPEMKRHRSFHLSSLYSLTVSFGKYAQEFLESYRYADRLKIFRQEWQALPWSVKEREKTQSKLANRCREYRGKLPPINEKPIRVILTCDVGEHRCWYVVRAWYGGATSYLLEYGHTPDVGSLAEIAEHAYEGEKITHAFIDYGWRGPTVIEPFCNEFGFIPMKGSGNLKEQTRWGKTQAGTRLLEFHDTKLKEELFDRMHSEETASDDEKRGQWYLFNDDGHNLNEYFYQMSSEQRKTKLNKQGFEVVEYVTTDRANHIFDCEKYNLGCALAMQLQYFDPVKYPEPQPEFIKAITPEKPKEEPPPIFRRPDGRDFYDIRR